MNIKIAQESIVSILEAGLTVMLTGSPGLGKSDVVRGIAKQFNLQLIDIRLSQCDPTDINGFPVHDGARMTYAPPLHFPLQELDKLPPGKDGWLLFLDEFNSASLAVQAASYRLVLDRQVGQYHLHKNVAIVCAGNKATDGAIVNRMSTAMQSRLIHLELEVDTRLWIEWATGNDIDHRIVSYLEGRPEHLHNFDPNHNDATFSCPRTWEFASKLIKDKDVSIGLLDILIGTLSAGIAHEFNAYLSYCSSLPSIQEIKKDPIGITIPEDPALLYAVSHMVASYIDEKDSDVLMKYVRRLPLEFGTTSIRAALKRKKELLTVPAIRDWAHEVAVQIF